MASRYTFTSPSRPDGWGRFGNVDVTTTVVMVVLSVFGMLLATFAGLATNNSGFIPLAKFAHSLPYSSTDVLRGQLWRLVTWPFIHTPSIWTAFSIFVFWQIGHMLESMLGRIGYLKLIGAVVIVPGVVAALLSLPLGTGAQLGGISIVVMVFFILLAMEHPNAPSFFGIPLWVLATVFAAISVLQLIQYSQWVTLVFQLAAVATGAFALRQLGYLTNMTFIPRLGGGTAQRRNNPPRARQHDPRDTVVDGPWASPSKPPPTPSSPNDQVELDRLLDKISAGGLESLSADEKRRLNELSKKLR